MPQRLILNEEEQLVRESAKSFFTNKMPVQHMRNLRDRSDPLGYDRNLWQQMAEIGWTGMLVPEAFGGVEFGPSGICILAEEAGRTLAPSPLFSTATLAASLLSRAAESQIRNDLLTQIASSEAVIGVALDEASWHDVTRTQATATQVASGYALNGEKVFIADGTSASAYLVLVRSSGENGQSEGLSLFAVKSEALPSDAVTPLKTLDSRNYARLSLNNQIVTAEHALGSIGSAAILLEPALDLGRAFLAAEMLGMAQECFDRTLEYLKERQQFGVKIGSFQALQHRAAKMFSELDATRSIVLAAALALQDGDEGTTALAAAAKAKAGETAYLVTNEAMQMHGGMGVTDELDFGLFTKRARAAEQLLGDREFCTTLFAAQNGF